MRYRRFVLFLMGAWIGASIFVAIAATQNFSTVDDVLKTPVDGAAKILKGLDPENARMLLRHVAGEENRAYFETWELVQIAIAVAVTVLLFLDSSTRKLCGFSLAMLLLVAFMHLKLTPELVYIGRQIEFLAWMAEPGVRQEFASLHRMYGIMEVAKLLVGAVLTGFLLGHRGTKRVRRRTIADNMELVDHAHHRHVDR